MSRIDKALRAWEDSAGVRRHSADEFTRTGSTTLTDYAAESESGQRSAPVATSVAARVVVPPISDRAPAAPLTDRPSVPPPIDRAPVGPLVDRTPVRPAAREVELPLPPVAAPSRPRPAADQPAAPVGEFAPRLIHRAPSGVPVEQYRRLAATLHDIHESNGLKTVMVTSAAPAEGKTLTSVNLAYTLSDSYARKVLVIDADLRRPALHLVYGVNHAPGLSEVLGEDGLELPIIQVSERLFVLPAGQSATPLAGLSSPRMRTVLTECERHFDWILVDTPPVGVLPDAQLLARLTGGVVFVIGAGSTPAPLVSRSVAEIGAECIIGTVLNRVDTHTISQAGYIDRYHSKHVEAAS